MTPSIINQTKVRHRVRTLGILTSMAVILGLVGFSVSGTTGLTAAVLLVVFGAFFTPKLPSRMIMRLYRARPVSPNHAPNLYHILAQLARNAGMNNIPKLYYIPNRSINAFAAGSAGDPAIAVTKGLLSVLSTSEIAGILGHELSHIRNNDTGVMSFAGILLRLTHVMSLLGLMLIVFLIPMVLIGNMPISFSFLFIIILAPTISALLQLALSRTMEFDADLGSATLLGSPYPLAQALQTLESIKKRSWHRFILPPSVTGPPELFSTHPDTSERIHRLISLDTRSCQKGKKVPYMASRPILIPMDSAH